MQQFSALAFNLWITILFAYNNVTCVTQLSLSNRSNMKYYSNCYLFKINKRKQKYLQNSVAILILNFNSIQCNCTRWNIKASNMTFILYCILINLFVISENKRRKTICVDLKVKNKKKVKKYVLVVWFKGLH